MQVISVRTVSFAALVSYSLYHESCVALRRPSIASCSARLHSSWDPV